MLPWKGLVMVVTAFGAFFNTVVSLEQEPALECLDDGMRLHFVPATPFSGHVYVKGFFFSRHCHLDYTRRQLTEPFFFHVPLARDCQVRRERRPAGATAYSTVVVVQHHPLFVTAADSAFDVACVYPAAAAEGGERLLQQLEVGEPRARGLSDERRPPDCLYQVLRGAADGPPVKFANIGDVLVHKWACRTETQGILVHSCFVRDGVGNEVPLLDDRGCAANGSLMEAPTYAADLKSAHAQLNAFKFADQMVVYFSCQITLCRRAEQGCEGITPPLCTLHPPPEALPTSTPMSTRTTDSTERNETAELPDQDIQLPEAQSAEDVLPNLFHSAPYLAAKHARRRKRLVLNGTEITMDVAADSLIVFTKDENPAGSLALRMDNICSAAYGHLEFGWAGVLIGVLASASALLLIQRRRYETRLSDMARLVAPLEMSVGQLPRTAYDNQSFALR